MKPRNKKQFVGFCCLAIRSATKSISEFSYYHLSSSDLLICLTKDKKNNILKTCCIGNVLRSVL